jgi:hypothetical protein
MMHPLTETPMQTVSAPAAVKTIPQAPNSLRVALFAVVLLLTVCVYLFEPYIGTRGQAVFGIFALSLLGSGHECELESCEFEDDRLGDCTSDRFGYRGYAI